MLVEPWGTEWGGGFEILRLSSGLDFLSLRGVKLILSSKAAFEAAFGGFNDQHLIVIMSRALSASFCRCSQSGRVLGCCVVHVIRIPCHGSCSLWFFLVLQLILLVLVVLWCRGVSHATFSSHFDSSSILWQSQCPSQPILWLVGGGFTFPYHCWLFEDC